MLKSKLPVHLIVLLALSPLLASSALAEPCLMAYPDGPSIYHFESAEEYLVYPGDPLYDPAYDRGGAVIIDANTGEIAYEIYQASGMTGFQLDEDHQGWFYEGMSMDLVLDGWSNIPRMLTNVTLVMNSLQSECMGLVTVNGQPATQNGNGDWIMPIGDLYVSTPTPNGNNYSDTITVSVQWSACLEIDIWAFADENYDGIRQGGECRTAFSKNTTIPVDASSWGQIKASFD